MTKFLAGYHRLLKALLTVLMGLLIIPVSLQVLSRYTGIIPRYIWTEEAARFCFVWIIMIGSMIAVRDRSISTWTCCRHRKLRGKKASPDSSCMA